MTSGAEPQWDGIGRETHSGLASGGKPFLWDNVRQGTPLFGMTSKSKPPNGQTSWASRGNPSFRDVTREIVGVGFKKSFDSRPSFDVFSQKKFRVLKKRGVCQPRVGRRPMIEVKSDLSNNNGKGNIFQKR